MNYDESKASKPKKKAAEPIKLKDDGKWFDPLDASLIAFALVFAVVLFLIVVTKKGTDYTPLEPAKVEEAKPAPKTYKEPGSARDIFQENFSR